MRHGQGSASTRHGTSATAASSSTTRTSVTFATVHVMTTAKRAVTPSQLGRASVLASSVALSPGQPGTDRKYQVSSAEISEIRRPLADRAMRTSHDTSTQSTQAPGGTASTQRRLAPVVRGGAKEPSFCSRRPGPRHGPTQGAHKLNGEQYERHEKQNDASRKTLAACSSSSYSRTLTPVG